jgi:small subunit ribosomal protein S6
MRKYELMTIMHADTDPTDTKKRDSILAKLLGDDVKYVTKTESMGKKKLAYPINKKDEGVYCLTNLEAPAIQGSLITKNAKLMPEVVRFMLIEV